MDSVVVLIAASGSGAIDQHVLRLLREAGGPVPHWLAQGDAAEFPTFDRLPEFLVDVRRLPIDAAIVSIHNRRKRLLIADMDSTMIHQECIDELGSMAGVGDAIRSVTARAMRGELGFADALRERVKLLSGLEAGIIDRVIRERISFMPGGKTLVATMRKHGAYAALVSGGFTQFTSHVGSELGFDECQANRLVIRNGRLTGEVEEPILGQEAKVDALRRVAAARGLDCADAVAVGDGANDVSMLAEAGMGVALHAKPHVQENSLIRINHGDLTSLLYLQGYRQSEFVPA